MEQNSCTRATEAGKVEQVGRRQMLSLAIASAMGGWGVSAIAQTAMPRAPAQGRFAELDAALQRHVDNEMLPGVSYAVMRRGQPVASGVFGWADREARIPLRTDHLFRAFSNTKLAVSCAALQLMEQGRLKLDDPVEAYLPSMRDMRVLRAGSSDVNELVPAARPVTLRHLLAHTSGMTYTFLDPTAPIGRLYAQSRMLDPSQTLTHVAEVAGRLPLLFQPGSDWNYSMGTDVAGRVLEVVTGKTLDAVLKEQVFDPLDMRDTFFFVPPSKQDRLAAMYVGDLKDPAKPGLRRADELPYPGANVNVVPRLFAGGGLVTTLPDWMKLLSVLSTGGAPLLRPDTMPWVMQNQLPEGMWIKALSNGARVPGRGHSLVGSVTTGSLPAGWFGTPGDVEWGGLAGTHWLLSPRDGIACAIMTQRYMAFELPFWMEFKRLMRGALDA